MISISGSSLRMRRSGSATNPTAFCRQMKRCLVASALLILAVEMASAGSIVSGQQNDKFGLLIGNATYPSADIPLTDTVDDARALGKELRNQGFDVDIGENLSKAAMESALERFYAKITPGSTALIFFSGYGIQSNRQSYIIPIDAAIWVETDVKRYGLNLDAALAEMDRRGARVKVAILDASRRNPFERQFRPGAAGLAAISGRRTAVLLSATPGSLVSETEPGVFMRELLKQIPVTDATVEEVFNRTRTGVSRGTKSQQVPWFSSSLEDEFRFQSSSRAPTSRPEPPPVQKYKSAASETNPAPKAQPELPNPQIATPEPSPGSKPGPATDPTAGQNARPTTSEPSAAPKPFTSPIASDVVDDGIRKLDEVLQTRTDVSELYKRGELYAKKADFSSALKDFDEVIRADPKHAVALNNRCWVRAILGEDLRSARKDCDDALRLKSDYADAFDSRGMVNLKTGSFREAIADYDRALDIDRKHASAFYGRGIAKLRSGNTAAGKTDINAAKAIKSDIAEEFATYGIRQ